MSHTVATHSLQGREELLKQLHDNLTQNKAAALTQAQAIYGLGGIGKTQTAVEYAYRYRDEYRSVLWVNATTRDELITSFVGLATLLNLTEQQEQDQTKIVEAVKHWFTTHNEWLLIVDNADDLAMAGDFLPASGKGHLLLNNSCPCNRLSCQWHRERETGYPTGHVAPPEACVSILI